jgi:hypothetical protein
VADMPDGSFRNSNPSTRITAPGNDRPGRSCRIIIHDHQLDRHTELERAQALDYACNPVFLVVRGYNEADSLGT